jgi:methionine sulfoxide reductase heme-binding subunit
MQTKLGNIKDVMIVLASIMIIGLSVVVAIHNGMFSISLSDDELLTWHLIRSSGIFAYILLTVSMIWGLFLSNQLIKDWSPGPVSMTIHSTLSWLGVVLSLIHALLLMVDAYFTYTLADVFVPFTGPYRPLWVGFGTLSFWIMLLVTISFVFKKWMGQKMWKRLHYLSYGVYLMSTLHGLFAGSDSGLLGFRVMIAIGVLTVVMLTGARIGKQSTEKPRDSQAKSSKRARRSSDKPVPSSS